MRLLRYFTLFLMMVVVGCGCYCGDVQFPLSISDYQLLEQANDSSLWNTLALRVKASPFNLVATIIFLCAVIHTFFVPKIARLAHDLSSNNTDNYSRKQFLANVCHWLSEVEVVFCLWCIPLVLMMGISAGWSSVINYFNNDISFAEPIFIAVIMTMAATRPIVLLAESILGIIARIGNRTVGAWWLTLLMVAPFLGSFVTEPAAMTIAAMLLSKQVYSLGPSKRLSYGTLGLLFVNVSIGGTLTHFAAPPILMVAHKWHLTIGNVFSLIGQHAIVSVICATLLYYFIFRKEFSVLQRRAEERKSSQEDTAKMPIAMTVIHVLFLIWTVANVHVPALVVLGSLIFLAFVQVTEKYQDEISLRGPILVGVFLFGLVVHGGLQQWWLEPMLGGLSQLPLFFGATVLTSFNDNAAITYLSSLVPDFTNNVALQKSVISGAVAGGGLTVIANAPNPAGQSILLKHFNGMVSPLFLFLAALIPTIIAAICFNLW